MCLSLKWWRSSANIKLNKEKTFISTSLTLLELYIVKSLQVTNGKNKRGKTGLSTTDWDLNFKGPGLSCCLDTINLQASMQWKMGEMTSLRQGSESQHIELECSTRILVNARIEYNSWEWIARRTFRPMIKCCHVLESDICNMRNGYIWKPINGNQTPKCWERAFSDRSMWTEVLTVCFLFIPSSFLLLYPFLKFFLCYLHIKTSGIGFSAPAIGSRDFPAADMFLSGKINEHSLFSSKRACFKIWFWTNTQLKK